MLALSFLVATVLACTFSNVNSYTRGGLPHSRYGILVKRGHLNMRAPKRGHNMLLMSTVVTDANRTTGDKYVKTAVRDDMARIGKISNDKWLQAIVQRVSDIGLFVRPAGFDAVGLVHVSQIPRDLVTALQKQTPASSSSTTTTKTVAAALFSEGDVVRVRVNGLNEDGKLGMTMLPHRTDSGSSEDNYVVEGRDPEGQKYRSYEYDDDDEASAYDAQDTLLWWKGAPYAKVSIASADDDSEEIDEEIAIMSESRDLVEGTWRRMLEIDMREEQADFSSKIMDKEMEELNEEIGELAGLEEMLLDSLGVAAEEGSASIYKDFGSYVSPSSIPADWKEQMTFFSKFESIQSIVNTKLRGGKSAEQDEFDSLLKEVESELQAASRRGGGGASSTSQAFTLPDAETVAAPAPDSTTETESSIE